MTFQALPTYYPQFHDPSGNLAALGAIAPLWPTQQRTPYYAWDGTLLGYSSTCDPVNAEPALSGFEPPRFSTGESFALPLVLGMAAFGRGGALSGLLWALGAYYAPLPAAAVWASGIRFGG